MTAALNWWPSLALLALLGVFWLEWRLLGARATLPLRSFGLLFVAGVTVIPLACLFLERAVAGRIGYEATANTAGPLIEEAAKAAPVLLLVFVVDRWRTLSVADAALAGAVTGLGFQFVETNLRLLASGSALGDASGMTPLLSGLSVATGAQVGDVGHSIHTALVGLAAGAGSRFLRGPASIALPGLALLWVTLDHGIFNWEVAQLLPLGSYPNEASVENPQLPAGVLGVFYRLDLHGLLELPVVVFGLLAATIAEGRSCRRAMTIPAYWLLPGEDRPRAFTEIGFALARLSLDLRPFRDTTAYFRHRRTVLLTAAASNARATDTALAERLEALRADLTLERAQLDELPPASHAYAAARARAWITSHPGAIVLAVLLVVFFMVSRRQLPGGLASSLYSGPVAALLVLLALGAVLWRINIFPKERPRPAHPVERQLAYYGGAAILAFAALTALLVVLGAITPDRVVFGRAFIVNAFAEWAGAFGRIDVLFALAALVAANASPRGQPRLGSGLLPGPSQA